MLSPPEWLRTRPVAHRGLHDPEAGAPENSLAAFDAAIVRDFAIELDVRLSRDNIPMVFHDAALDRMCGRFGLVREAAATELQRYSLLQTAERIPTLDEVLRLVAGRVPLLIEVKNYNKEPVEPLAAAVAQSIRDYRGDFAVQSFNPRTVAWFRRRAPEFVRGQIASDMRETGNDLNPLQQLGLRAMLANRYGAPHFVAFNVNYLPAPMTERARRDGLPVLAWTVRDQTQLQRARVHADNVIFEGIEPS